MKAVISNRVYFRNKDILEEVKKSLTYSVSTKTGRVGSTKFVEKIKLFKEEANGLVSIPIGRTDLIPDDWEILDNRVTVPVTFPEPSIPLRDTQAPIIEKINDSCILNAKPGWGKTFAALHLAKKLGQKTLIVTTTGMLRDQWIQEIERLFGIQAGTIMEGKMSNMGSIIVVGNVQSVTKYSSDVSKSFGLLVMDECHHVSADTFVSIVDKSHARYKVGLSATIKRSDGKEFFLENMFSMSVFAPPETDTMIPRVKIVPTGIRLPAGTDYAKKVNALLYDADYQSFIAGVALSQMHDGHSVLIPAERTEFLTNIQELIGESCVLITGETTASERERYLRQIDTEEALCVAGSRQIWAEGISANRLSCVILCSLTSNEIYLEQVIGRIRRQHPSKPQPLIIDITFSSPSEKRQARERMQFYLKQGWQINSI